MHGTFPAEFFAFFSTVKQWSIRVIQTQTGYALGLDTVVLIKSRWDRCWFKSKFSIQHRERFVLDSVHIGLSVNATTDQKSHLVEVVLVSRFNDRKLYDQKSHLS